MAYRGIYVEHSFYCINCGNKGIPLMRKQGMMREAMHRKRLYCYHCRTDVNHVECRTLEEIEAFQEDFEQGLYTKEAEESLTFVGKEKI